MGRKPAFLATAVGLFGFAEPILAADGVTAQPIGITAQDLNSLLHLKCWKYRVRLAQPVREVSATVYEMRRQPGADWRKEPILEPMVFGARNFTFKEVTVTVVAPENRRPLLRLEANDGIAATTSQTGTKAKRPDFSKMVISSDGKTIVDGCIVLAAEYKDSAVTGHERDMERVIGLEIKTK